MLKEAVRWLPVRFESGSGKRGLRPLLHSSTKSAFGLKGWSLACGRDFSA